jgi:hypothetical protein
LFDYDFIKRLLNEHRTGRVNYSFFLWNLLNLSLWHDQWIDRQGTETSGHQAMTSMAKPGLSSRKIL